MNNNHGSDELQPLMDREGQDPTEQSTDADIESQESVCGDGEQEPVAEQVPSSEDTVIGTQEFAAEDPAQEEAAPVAEKTSPCPLSLEIRPDLDGIKAVADKITAQLDDMSKLFSNRIMYVEYEEKVVDQMHKELQKHREGLYAQLIRPILLDIIEVRDSILRIAAAYLAKPEGSQAIPNKTFSDYSYDLQDILEKNNVEIYRSKEGDTYAPIRQRAVNKRPTSDPALHGKIAESLSCGYNFNGGTISAEKVAVYFYEQPKTPEQKENEEATTNG